MGIRQIDLLQGTLDLLILKSLSTGANHGYGIATRIHQLSDDVLKVDVTTYAIVLTLLAAVAGRAADGVAAGSRYTPRI
jgi:DNA-binding PadR family transcriptional regulator